MGGESGVCHPTIKTHIYHLNTSHSWNNGITSPLALLRNLTYSF